MAADDGRIKVIDSLNFTDGRVKTTLGLLSKIKVQKSTLMVVEQKEPMVERATRNLRNVRLVKANYLTVFDILNADTIVITKKALEQIEARLGGKSG